jgi:histidinol-phosphate aminotransferase
MAFASTDIIHVMNKIKPPYNINQASQELAMQALDEVGQVNDMIREIVQEREWLTTELSRIPGVEKIYPSDANFLLVKMVNARGIYEALLQKQIVVRDRSRVELCEDCLRITVGTPVENKILISSLNDGSIINR